VKVAFVTVPVILALLLAGYGISRTATSWPPGRYDGWVLLGIVILSVLPILLLVLQALAAWGAKLALPGGVSLSFAAAVETTGVTVPTTAMTENLGTADDISVEQSTLRSVLRALRRARDSDAIVVDLRQGLTWWESRLFLLIAGAAQRDRPQAVAFVGQCGGRRQVFLGWATPNQLLDLHLRAVPTLAYVYAQARASAARWRVGVLAPPYPGTAPTVTYPWDTTNQQQSLPLLQDELADPEFALELYLQQQLDLNHPELRTPVTITRLQELYQAELVTDSVDADADDATWARLLATRPERFFAITKDGKFSRLVARDALVTTMLARLVAAQQPADKKEPAEPS
jgi:hypothetical protein